MTVHFTPAKSGALRVYRSPELECHQAGDYEVSDELGAQLCKDFPDNFKAVGGAKSVGKPASNRAAPAPGKDK